MCKTNIWTSKESNLKTLVSLTPTQLLNYIVFLGTWIWSALLLQSFPKYIYIMCHLQNWANMTNFDYLHFLAKFLTYKFEKEVCKRPETLNVKRNLEGSHRMCSVKEFTGKQLCQSLKACYFIKQEALAQVFFCEFCEISKSNFSTEHILTAASRNPIFSLDCWSNRWIKCLTACYNISISN